MLAIPENEPLTGVKAKALELALKQLDALGAKYAVLLPNGEKFGTLEVQPEKVGKHYRRPRGELLGYVTELMKDMTPGDVKVIERSHWDVWSVHSTVMNYAQKTWGDKSVVAETSKEAGTVEVMRVL